MGPSIVCLPCLLLPILMGAGRQDSPTLAELRDEYNAIVDLLGEPDTVEEGRSAIQGFVERLAQDPNLSPGVVYARSIELARKPAWCPSALDRARYFEIASGAAARDGYPTSALSAAQESAWIHMAHGDTARAARVLRTVLEGPAADSPRVIQAEVELAVVELGLGNHLRALELAEAVSRSPETEPWARVARDSALLVRSAVARELGSPERHRLEVEALAQRHRERAKEGEGDRSAGHAAEVELLRIASAAGNHGAVREVAGALLAAGDSLSDSQRAELLLLRGTSRLEGERSQRLRGEEPERRAFLDFEAILGLHPDGREAYFARTRLAEEALARGEADAARLHLDALEGWVGEGISTGLRSDAAVLAARIARESGADPEARGRAKARLEGEWSTLLSEWESALEVERGVAFLKYAHRREVLAELIELELGIDSSVAGLERSLAHVFEAQERSALALSLSRSAVDGDSLGLAELRAQLLVSDDHGLLIALPARNGTHVFAIDRGTTTHHRLPSSSILMHLRSRWVSWLSLAGVEELAQDRLRDVLEEERARAHALAHAWLPLDLRERLSPWTRISLNGMDLLGPLPWAWLPLDGSPYLGIARAVDEVPSIPHAIRQARTEDAGRASLGLLMFTDAIPTASVVRSGEGSVVLGAGIREILGDLYPGASLDLRSGDRAHGCALADLDLSKVETLHFFTHGVNVPEERVPRFLALSPCEGGGRWAAEGLLGAGTIGALRGAPGLVVMTACGSGQGPTLRGDPHVGSLVGAWLRKGARTVIASHRDLSVAEGRRSTRVLHRALARGESPAQALRSLRCDVVEERGELAPFVLGMQQASGLGQQPLSSGHLRRVGGVGDRGLHGSERRGPWGARFIAALGVLGLGVLGVAIYALTSRKGR